MNAKKREFTFCFYGNNEIENGSVPLLTTLSLDPSNFGFPVFAFFCGYLVLSRAEWDRYPLSDLSFKQFILDSPSSMAA
jgi:hypothetical protein